MLARCVYGMTQKEQNSMSVLVYDDLLLLYGGLEIDAKLFHDAQLQVLYG
jgi:hypothetical protein